MPRVHAPCVPEQAETDSGPQDFGENVEHVPLSLSLVSLLLSPVTCWAPYSPASPPCVESVAQITGWPEG